MKGHVLILMPFIAYSKKLPAHDPAFYKRVFYPLKNCFKCLGRIKRQSIHGGSDIVLVYWKVEVCKRRNEVVKPIGRYRFGFMHHQMLLINRHNFKSLI